MISLLLAYGIRTLRLWAFWVTVIIEVLNVLGGMFSLATGSCAFAAIVLAIFAPMILVCLFVNRAAFRA